MITNLTQYPILNRVRETGDFYGKIRYKHEISTTKGRKKG